eukprot:TRINITY_DN44020_c0_g1_i1.p1 TRINITY_DN44020_c0_g1~~TRINITY_DN44020_c0_g1_i1.p1  ORF type:complete len:420 (+),score=14.01 TRINITY_DN44020_c0_g1_i1:83-1342(+)
MPVVKYDALDVRRFFKDPDAFYALSSADQQVALEKKIRENRSKIASLEICRLVDAKAAKLVAESKPVVFPRIIFLQIACSACFFLSFTEAVARAHRFLDPARYKVVRLPGEIVSVKRVSALPIMPGYSVPPTDNSSASPASSDPTSQESPHIEPSSIIPHDWSVQYRFWLAPPPDPALAFRPPHRSRGVSDREDDKVVPPPHYAVKPAPWWRQRLPTAVVAWVDKIQPSHPAEFVGHGMPPLPDDCPPGSAVFVSSRLTAGYPRLFGAQEAHPTWREGTFAPGQRVSVLASAENPNECCLIDRPAVGRMLLCLATSVVLAASAARRVSAYRTAFRFEENRKLGQWPFNQQPALLRETPHEIKSAFERRIDALEELKRQAERKALAPPDRPTLPPGSVKKSISPLPENAANALLRSIQGR